MGYQAFQVVHQPKLQQIFPILQVRNYFFSSQDEKQIDKSLFRVLTAESSLTTMLDLMDISIKRHHLEPIDTDLELLGQDNQQLGRLALNQIELQFGKLLFSALGPFLGGWDSASQFLIFVL
jgi:hypothetical protein